MVALAGGGETDGAGVVVVPGVAALQQRPDVSGGSMLVPQYGQLGALGHRAPDVVDYPKRNNLRAGGRAARSVWWLCGSGHRFAGCAVAASMASHSL
jgi:hypothetical protein